VKSFATNSFLLLLSSTLVTALVAVFWHDQIFPNSASQTAAVASHLNTEETDLVNTEFVSFEDILRQARDQVTTTEPVRETEDESGSEILNEEVSTSDVFIPPPSNIGDAIVHIVCNQKTDKFSKKISGSGFFISSRGVIITNAHMAQFLLLRGIEGQGTMNCSASTGAEGAPAFNIELLHISPTWLLENASLISTITPKGSGESDFALLYVTGTVDGQVISEEFAHLPPSTNPLPREFEGKTVILVGYPKEGGIGANTRTTATTTVKNLYTFGGGAADIISLNESPLGYHGASGGPVIDHLGRAIGIISTKASGSTVLHAISMSYVDRSIKEEAGIDLVSLLQGDLKAKAEGFNALISPILQKILTENLD
jgi:S1-C subfamily serine protease